MPRRARLEIPGIPLHITQRGVNRAAVFVDDDDRDHYLALLGATLHKHGVALHAYVLMGNHVHLLASAAHVGSISQALRNPFATQRRLYSLIRLGWEALTRRWLTRPVQTMLDTLHSLSPEARQNMAVHA